MLQQMNAPALRVSLAALASRPLAANARPKLVAIQAGLDALEDNVAAALVQLEANRDVALAALLAGVVTDVTAEDVLAVYTFGVDTVNAVAPAKRAALETELVVADAVLGKALEESAALAQVRLWMPKRCKTSLRRVLLHSPHYSILP